MYLELIRVLLDEAWDWITDWFRPRQPVVRPDWPSSSEQNDAGL